MTAPADEVPVDMNDDDDITTISTDNVDETKATLDTPAVPSTSGSLAARVKERMAAAKTTPAAAADGAGSGSGSGSGSEPPADLKDKALKATASKQDRKEDKDDLKEKKKAAAATSGKSSKHRGGAKPDTIAPQMMIRRPDEELKETTADQLGTLWWPATAAQPLEDSSATFAQGRLCTPVPADLDLRIAVLNAEPGSKQAATRNGPEGAPPPVFAKGRLEKAHFGDLIPLVNGKPDLDAFRPSVVVGGTEKYVGRRMRNKQEMPSQSVWIKEWSKGLFENKNIDAKTGQTMIPDEFVMYKCGLKDLKRLHSNITVELGMAKKVVAKKTKAGDDGDENDDEEEEQETKSKGAKNGKGKRKAAAEAEDQPKAKKAKKEETSNGKEAKTTTAAPLDDSDAELEDSPTKLSPTAALLLKNMAKEKARHVAVAQNNQALWSYRVAYFGKKAEALGIPKAQTKPILSRSLMDETDD